MKIRRLRTGGNKMELDNKQTLSGFIQDGRFELNHYLAYLFNQFKNSQKNRRLDDNQCRKITNENNL